MYRRTKRTPQSRKGKGRPLDARDPKLLKRLDAPTGLILAFAVRNEAWRLLHHGVLALPQYDSEELGNCGRGRTPLQNAFRF